MGMLPNWDAKTGQVGLLTGPSRWALGVQREGVQSSASVKIGNGDSLPFKDEKKRMEGFSNTEQSQTSREKEKNPNHLN